MFTGVSPNTSLFYDEIEKCYFVSFWFEVSAGGLDLKRPPNKTLMHSGEAALMKWKEQSSAKVLCWRSTLFQPTFYIFPFWTFKLGQYY